MADSSYQPSQEAAYQTAGNPVDHKPNEAHIAEQNARSDSQPIAHRGPSDTLPEDAAVPTSRSRGIHGAPPGEETRGYTQDKLDSEALDAAQMAAPGEGKIYEAVQQKSGASGAQPGLESDLDRKKQEHEEARRTAQGEDAARRREVDVGGVLNARS